MTRWINGIKPSDVLTGPEKWTKGAFARDIDGGVHEPESVLAFSFCIQGVVRLCATDPFVERRRLKAMLRASYLDAWNDATYRTFDEVITALLKLEAM